MADELPLETFDAADPAAEANAKRDASRQDRDDADVLRLLMHTKQGRAWLYRFLSKCNIYGETFSGEQTHTSAFKQGQENIGKQLMLETQGASVDLYMKMIKEQQDEEKRLDEVRRKERKVREEAEAPPTAEEMVSSLPPPAGYPGGPPLTKPKGKSA